MAAFAVEAADIGIYEWVPSTDCAMWSKAMRRLHGVGPDEALGVKRGLACIHPDDAGRVRDALAAALDPDGDGLFKCEYRTLAPGGVPWIESVGRVRFAERDGKRVPLVLAGVAIDITARKQIEAELIEADRRKDEFLAMLGHELRNPLAPLRTACELIDSGELEPHQLEAVHQMITRQVVLMSRIVDDLLDTARIAQGKITISAEPVELDALLRSAVEAARPFTEPRHHRVELVTPGRGLWIRGDPARINQVVSNLLHNAAKFTPDGGRIRITLHRERDEGVIRVADDGKGISADLLPRVFELFVQGDHRTGPSEGGLGLGLALVRNLVSMQGGSASAASDGPGKGSEFVVRFPLVPPPRAHDEPRLQEHADATSRRVLVVDDNDDAAGSTRMLLEMAGHEVRTAASGEEALAIAQAWAPAAVLVDIGLPGIDGYEVARRLRSMPSARGALLAALTGYGGDEETRRSLAAGFDTHLVKPVVPEQLLVFVKRAPASPLAISP